METSFMADLRQISSSGDSAWRFACRFLFDVQRILSFCVDPTSLLPSRVPAAAAAALADRHVRWARPEDSDGDRSLEHSKEVSGETKRKERKIWSREKRRGKAGNLHSHRRTMDFTWNRVDLDLSEGSWRNSSSAATHANASIDCELNSPAELIKRCLRPFASIAEPPTPPLLLQNASQILI